MSGRDAAPRPIGSPDRGLRVASSPSSWGSLIGWRDWPWYPRYHRRSPANRPHGVLPLVVDVISAGILNAGDNIRGPRNNAIKVVNELPIALRFCSIDKCSSDSLRT